MKCCGECDWHKVSKVEIVGDHKNLKKQLFFIYFFFVFVELCCLQVMSFVVLFFMVRQHSMLMCVVCCVVFGWCALWNDEHSCIRGGVSYVKGHS
jgi:uncharacterized membrane protein YwaF